MKLVSEMPIGTSFMVTVWLHGTKRGKRKRQWQSVTVGYTDTPQPIESLKAAIFTAIRENFRPGWNPLLKVTQQYVTRDTRGIVTWEPFNVANTTETLNIMFQGATSEATK